MSEAGDNSADKRLRSLLERIENLEAEKKSIADDIRDIYTEAKAVGYDVTAMRVLIRLRKMTDEDRKERQQILETYANAIGLDLV